MVSQANTAVPLPPAQPPVGDILAWSLRRGRPVAAAAMRTVLGAAPATTVWTQEMVTELVWAGVVRWTRQTGETLPDGIAEALWLYLEYLAETGAMDCRSDPLPALQRPLRIWSGLDQDGRRRPPTARARPRGTRPPAPVVALGRPSGGRRVSRYR